MMYDTSGSRFYALRCMLLKRRWTLATLIVRSVDRIGDSEVPSSEASPTGASAGIGRLKRKARRPHGFDDQGLSPSLESE